ncbi:MAG: tyrosine-type recombinase/integrase [Ignavibacteria bacterium]
MYLLKPDTRSPFYRLAYLSPDGKLRQISTRQKTKSSALKFLKNFSETQTALPEIVPMSLQDFASEYLEYCRSKFSKSYTRGIDLSFTHLTEATGNLPLKDVSLNILSKFILKVYVKAKYSASAHFRNLRAAFNYAVDREYIQTNPLDKFKFPTMPKPVADFIDENELLKILACVSSEDLRDMYVIYFYSGARLTELINLTFDNVDLNGRFIKIANSETFVTKTKCERLIPVHKAVYDILIKKQSSGKGLVFSKGGMRFNGDYVSKNFKKAVRLAGFPNLHLHQLRHSFCSNLIKRNVSLSVVMQLAGHTNLSTTQRYLHVKTQTLVDAVDTLR